jgi:uncharacterized sulfatase
MKQRYSSIHPKDQDAFGEFFPIRCVRSGDLKLSVDLFDTDELYEIKANPLEKHNFIDDPASAAARNKLHDLLIEHMWKTKDLPHG